MTPVLWLSSVWTFFALVAQYSRDRWAKAILTLSKAEFREMRQSTVGGCLDGDDRLAGSCRPQFNFIAPFSAFVGFHLDSVKRPEYENAA